MKKFNKIISVFILITLIFTLCACKEKSNKDLIFDKEFYNSVNDISFSAISTAMHISDSDSIKTFGEFVSDATLTRCEYDTKDLTQLRIGGTLIKLKSDSKEISFICFSDMVVIDGEAYKIDRNIIEECRFLLGITDDLFKDRIQ